MNFVIIANEPPATVPGLASLIGACLCSMLEACHLVLADPRCMALLCSDCEPAYMKEDRGATRVGRNAETTARCAGEEAGKSRSVNPGLVDKACGEMWKSFMSVCER